MFVMSSKLYHIMKKISLFYFTYVEIYPHGTSSDFALNWDERCLGNCSIDTSRYIVFMHSSNSCHPKCTNTIQTFSTFLGVHDGEIELWTNGWKKGGGGVLLFLKWKTKVPVGQLIWCKVQPELSSFSSITSSSSIKHLTILNIFTFSCISTQIIGLLVCMGMVMSCDPRPLPLPSWCMLFSVVDDYFISNAWVLAIVR